jgi:predicted transcriptional regulator
LLGFRTILLPIAGLMVTTYRGPGRPPIGDDPESALASSERRREILTLIEQQPGIHSTEIRRTLDLGAGVVHHHLDKLVRSGLVETRPYAHAIRYYAAGRAPPEDDLSLLLPESAKRIALSVLRNPGRSSSDIAEDVGLYPTRVSTYLTRLQDAGLVQGHAEGRRIRYMPTAKLERTATDW